MVPKLNLSGLVPPVPAAAPPIAVRLPGGVTLSGITQSVGPTALEQVRALMGAANAALAPLSPVFTIIEALVNLKKFVEAVPGVLTDPGAVISAGNDVVKVIGKLAALVPQLSVPFMVLGLVDAMLALMDGILAELSTLAAQAQRIQAAREQAASLPDLASILDGAELQMKSQQANLGSALANVGALVELLNAFAGLVPGLPKIPLEVDMGGDLQAAVSNLRQGVDVLRAIRSKIPV